MKSGRVFKLMGIVLMGLFLTVQVEAGIFAKKTPGKKAIEMSIDKPMIELMAKAYGKSIDAGDIIRLQKMLNQVDHVTIKFKDKEASDYVLKFKQINAQELEAWMFEAGYLSSDLQVNANAGASDMKDLVMHFE